MPNKHELENDQEVICFDSEAEDVQNINKKESVIELATDRKQLLTS